MDVKSGEPTREEVTGAEKGKSETDTSVPVVGEKQGVDCRDKVKHYRKERLIVRNEDAVGGRARVTTGEERVLRGG